MIALSGIVCGFLIIAIFLYREIHAWRKYRKCDTEIWLMEFEHRRENIQHRLNQIALERANERKPK